MGKVKQIEIKNRTYYFYNNIINTEEFNSSSLKIDKYIDIYYIGQITIEKIDDCENIFIVNLLYLIIDKVDADIEENNANKYLVFDSADENEEVLKKYTELWDWIKSEMGLKKGECNSIEYTKDFIKIKFNTDYR